MREMERKKAAEIGRGEVGMSVCEGRVQVREGVSFTHPMQVNTSR